MKLNRKKHRGVPELNTAALPDLIFTVLFFFMIVTHMRQTDVKVTIKTPEGTELQKLQKKHTISYLYIGKDKKGQTLIQLNDKVIDPAQLTQAVKRERSKVSFDDQELFTVSIKADRDTPLEVIAQVKQALRDAEALNISYSGTIKDQD